MNFEEEKAALLEWVKNEEVKIDEKYPHIGGRDSIGGHHHQLLWREFKKKANELRKKYNLN